MPTTPSAKSDPCKPWFAVEGGGDRNTEKTSINANFKRHICTGSSTECLLNDANCGMYSSKYVSEVPSKNSSSFPCTNRSCLSALVCTSDSRMHRRSTHGNPTKKPPPKPHVTTATAATCPALPQLAPVGSTDTFPSASQFTSRSTASPTGTRWLACCCRLCPGLTAAAAEFLQVVGNEANTVAEGTAKKENYRITQEHVMAALEVGSEMEC
ncbi:unnamed protein product [Phytophthora fragariaefolia]|uniref:Unnamed protein product n=1 Tax=Phytophthora fragariaefolia TaxID=1490495 RepID=A0A9W6WWT0_9STRA|nr:unnamed protein product [Phytophthora fragariaefolia]